jgi:hypothetical protein
MIYLAPQIGRGTRQDMYRARGVEQPGSGTVNLGNGRFLLSVPHRIGDRRLTLLAEDAAEIRDEIAALVRPRPLLSGVREVWLAGQQVYVQTPAAGSVGLRGRTINLDQPLHHAFVPRRDWRDYYLDTLGYVPIGGGALPKTETFTAANGTLLTTYDANWLLWDGSGTFAINTNACYATAATNTWASWNGDTFNDAQYVFGTLVALASGQYIGLSLRGKPTGVSAPDGYTLYTTADNDDTWLFSVGDGSNVSIDTAVGGTWAVNDVMRFEAEGSTLRCLRNGGHIASSPYTHTDYATGKAGLSGFGGATTSRIDNVELGNLGAVAFQVPEDASHLVVPVWV